MVDRCRSCPYEYFTFLSGFMHIVINGWFLGQLTSGSGQYLHHLLLHLANQSQAQPASPDRLSVLVPVLRGESFDELQQRAAEADPRLGEWANVAFVPVAVPPLPRTLAKLWWEQIAVPSAARRLGAAMLWVPYWAAPLWQPMPVTVTVHDLIPQLLPEYRGGILQRAYTALVGFTARRAAAVITVSHASAQDIADHLGIPPERIHVVHHGPNTEVAAPSDPAARQRVQEKYELPARYFLYLGGFDRRKNVATTLRAYRRYMDEGGDPGVKLVIAGKLPSVDSEFAPDPQKIAAELGLSQQVQFCGWIDEADKAALYALAEAYLFPSLYEGFGMMVLEAMSAGTPVVTSAAPPTISTSVSKARNRPAPPPAPDGYSRNDQ